jgi:hypothetical protein
MLYLLIPFSHNTETILEKALFLGRCSRSFGSAMDLLIARKFSTTDVTNMSGKVHDLSACY